MAEYELLRGLPPYGDFALSIPDQWGGGGKEGIVVRFGDGDSAWVGNFRPGFSGLTSVLPHPDRHRVIVLAEGDCWAVDPRLRAAELLAEGVADVLHVPSTPDILLVDATAITRVGRAGVDWRTRRLSWDGLSGVTLAGSVVTGTAWDAIHDRECAFIVELETGDALAFAPGWRPN